MVSYPRERISASLVFTFCSDCDSLGSWGCIVCIRDCAFTPTKKHEYFLDLIKMIYSAYKLCRNYGPCENEIPCARFIRRLHIRRIQ